MSSPIDRNVRAFNRDIDTNEGYRYTTNARLSSYLANKRLTDATLKLVDFSNKKVVDIGCGDGAYTLELYDRGHPTSVHGIDPAEKAIDVARSHIGDRQVTFAVENAYSLPYADKVYDIAYLRGVLHH